MGFIFRFEIEIGIGIGKAFFKMGLGFNILTGEKLGVDNIKNM
jgi:hypothetical protein